MKKYLKIRPLLSFGLDYEWHLLFKTEAFYKGKRKGQTIYSGLIFFFFFTSLSLAHRFIAVHFHLTIFACIVQHLECCCIFEIKLHNRWSIMGFFHKHKYIDIIKSFKIYWFVPCPVPWASIYVDNDLRLRTALKI